MDKMNTDPEQSAKGDIILQMINLYNIEIEKQRVKLKYGQKFDIGKILEKEPFKEFVKKLQNKNKGVDIDWFIENLSRLLSWGTFDNIQSAEDAINDFNKLEIEVPEFVMNCFREIDKRTFYINTLIDDKKYEWSENKKNDYTSYLNKELQEYTYNKDNRQKYLIDLFNKIVTEIKETEDKVKNEYGYFIDSFYDGKSFIATKENLNDFFFHCEMQKKTINEFWNLLHILRNYIDNKNKLKELKKLTPQQTETKTKPPEPEIKPIFSSENIDAIKDKEDTRFWLKTFFDNEAQTNPEYRSFQREIRDNGWFTLNKVKVYTPELAVILSSNELPAKNMDTKEETILNCFPYLQTYIKAFYEGVKYFDAEFAISPNILYGANAEKYVRDIHFNYFHKRHPGSFTGWHSAKELYPVIITHKIINGHGYYSGIVSAVEEMVKKYPSLFQYFDKCEHNVPPQQTETNPETLQETETIKQKVENAFAFMQGKDPRKHKQILNDTDFQRLIDWVTYYFENDFSLPEISKPIQKVNTNKGNVIYTFKRFFKDIHPTRPRPNTLFELTKACFYEYRNDKMDNLKKTKKPQYYDQLISKNK